MDWQHDQDWQIEIQQAASEMRYPPTPDVSAAVLQKISAQKTSLHWPLGMPGSRKNWLAPALILLIVMAIALSFVPGVRAQIQEFLQIGPLRIFFPAPATSPVVSPTPIQKTLTPQNGLLNLAGKTTLVEAASRWHYPVELPTYPADLGNPDLVYLQGPNDETLILVWLSPGDPEQVYLALQFIAPGESVYFKNAPSSVEQTKVNGKEAYWIVGEHLFEMQNGDFTFTRLVEGHVLVWTSDALTYRLESDLPLEEAVRIAESLR